MKKIVSILISIIFLLNVGLAYTSTVIIKGVSIKVSGEEGSTVEIKSKTPDVVGWDVKTGNTTVVNDQFVMPAGDVIIEGIIEETSRYLLTVDLPYFKTEEERAVGEVITIEALTETGNLMFTGWTSTGVTLTAEQQVSPSITFTMPGNPVTLVANYQEAGTFNAPVVAEGLTPVNWNGTTWVATDEANWDYNYDIATAGHGTVEGDGTGKWANAQTADGSMYVWIPRYTYKITSGEHSTGNSWSSVDSPGTNKIEVKFSNGTTDDTSDSYKKHPAFTFGTDELEGIWVAKYEASRNDATADSVGTGTTVTIKPGVQSWRNLTVSDMYDYAYNMNRTLDSHLMKNSEWGAVAYLTNAIGKIPYINNSISYITGNAGGSQDASNANGVTNAWNTANGVKASSTHNIYGIYDLSGGAWEYVATYLENADNGYMDSLVTNKDTKYVEVYPANDDGIAYTSSVTGDAVYETSGDCYNYNTSTGDGNASWDGDCSYAPGSGYPVFARGGSYYDGSGTGVFCFYRDAGYAVSNLGFRPVLAIPSTTGGETTQTYTVTYNANGGTGTMSTQTFTSGVAQNLTTNTFTRDGYTFAGWSTTANGSVEYGDGASYTATSDTTLYAIWEEIAAITMVWDTTGDLEKSITVNTNGATTIDWGDGTVEDVASGSNLALTHTYTTEGNFAVKIADDVVENLSCIKNNISSLDVSKNTALTILHCYLNQLSSLNVSNNTALTTLQCHANQLSSLDVSKNTALTQLYCYSNQLSSLDVSKNTALTRLFCYSNQLSSLDVSNNTALTQLYCSSNQLSSLDVSKNTALTQLYCSSNQLSSLDVSKNTALTQLDCSPNQLSSLDVSKNTALTELICSQSTLNILVMDSNQTVEPERYSNTYIVRMTQSENGAISYTDGLSFAITPNEEYEVSTLTVGGISVTPATTYTFESLTADTTITATFGVAVAWNAPKLGTGLTPVNWNGTTWVTTDEANWDYNYEIATAGHNTVAGDGTGKWANAQTADGSMYVWIPRYTYKITSGEHQDVDSWSSVDTPGTGKIEVKFSKGTIDDTTDSYKKHPAFTFGTDELEGIWVAKYEASRNDATADSVGTGTTVTVKPGVQSWRRLTVSDMYDYAYNMNRTLDSHLMKNSEWGAVAYLTNAIGKIPYINNSGSYITGNAGRHQDANWTSETTTNAWNTVNGVKASSTHNVYGIYDLSGGSFEYVATYLEGGSTSYMSSLITNKDTKYVEVYPANDDGIAYTSSITGDAVYETSGDCYNYNTGNGSKAASWDGDYSYTPYSDSPVFTRGGSHTDTSLTGVFYFGRVDGCAYAYYGFRPVLAIP